MKKTLFGWLLVFSVAVGAFLAVGCSSSGTSSGHTTVYGGYGYPYPVYYGPPGWYYDDDDDDYHRPKPEKPPDYSGRPHILPVPKRQPRSAISPRPRPMPRPRPRPRGRRR